MTEITGPVSATANAGLMLATKLNTLKVVFAKSWTRNGMSDVVVQVSTTAISLSKLQALISPDEDAITARSRDIVFTDDGVLEIQKLARKANVVYNLTIALLCRAGWIAKEGGKSNKTPLNLVDPEIPVYWPLFDHVDYEWLAPRLKRCTEQLKWLNIHFLFHLQLAEVARIQMSTVTIGRTATSFDEEVNAVVTARHLRREQRQLALRVVKQHDMTRTKIAAMRKLRADYLAKAEEETKKKEEAKKNAEAEKEEARKRAEFATAMAKTALATWVAASASNTSEPADDTPVEAVVLRVAQPQAVGTNHVDPVIKAGPITGPLPNGTFPRDRSVLPPYSHADIQPIPKSSAGPEPHPTLLEKEPQPARLSLASYLSKWRRKTETVKDETVKDDVSVSTESTLTNLPMFRSRLPSFLTGWAHSIFGQDTRFHDDEPSLDLEAYVMDTHGSNPVKIPFGHRRLHYGLSRVLKGKKGDPLPQFKACSPYQRAIIARVTEHARAQSCNERTLVAFEQCKTANRLTSFIVFFAVGNEELPVFVRDGIGRKFSFPYQSCRTWGDMRELLSDACSHVNTFGLRVRSGHYDLLDDRDQIIHPAVWDTVIKPGARIRQQMWPPNTPLRGPPGPMMRPGGPRMHPGPGFPGRQGGVHPPPPRWASRPAGMAEPRPVPATVRTTPVPFKKRKPKVYETDSDDISTDEEAQLQVIDLKSEAEARKDLTLQDLLRRFTNARHVEHSWLKRETNSDICASPTSSSDSDSDSDSDWTMTS